jgi:uncharacterized protein YcbK (DUF882 family)
MKITEHFSVHEFDCRDGTPYPPEWIESRLRPLCEDLELIRSTCGDNPITINSGYRTPAHNRSQRGARRSKHLYGIAADIVVKNHSALQVFKKIQELHRQIGLKNIRAVLYEPRRGINHVDLRESAEVQFIVWNK